MVLVWDENGSHVPRAVHPAGIRGTIANSLDANGIDCHTAQLDEADAGLSPSVLDEASVLVWWGHSRHDEVPDTVVQDVVGRVRTGDLGLVLLHSAHQSKIAEAVFGNRVYSKGGWDDEPQMEEVRVCAPWHPVCDGVLDFVLGDEEFYGAPANFPPAEVVLLQSRFPRYGAYYPSGLVWTVGEGIVPLERSGSGHGIGQGEGAGRVVYLRFGHETSRSLSHPEVQRLLANATDWASGSS